MNGTTPTSNDDDTNYYHFNANDNNTTMEDETNFIASPPKRTAAIIPTSSSSSSWPSPYRESEYDVFVEGSVVSGTTNPSITTASILGEDVVGDIPSTSIEDDDDDDDDDDDVFEYSISDYHADKNTMNARKEQQRQHLKQQIQQKELQLQKSSIEEEEDEEGDEDDEDDSDLRGIDVLEGEQVNEVTNNRMISSSLLDNTTNINNNNSNPALHNENEYYHSDEDDVVVVDDDRLHNNHPHDTPHDIINMKKNLLLLQQQQQQENAIPIDSSSSFSPNRRIRLGAKSQVQQEGEVIPNNNNKVVEEEEGQMIYWDEELNQEIRFSSGEEEDNDQISSSYRSSEWSEDDDEYRSYNSRSYTSRSYTSQDFSSYRSASSFYDGDEDTYLTNEQQEMEDDNEDDEIWNLRRQHRRETRTHSSDNMPAVYPFASPLGLASSRSRSFDQKQQDPRESGNDTNDSNLVNDSTIKTNLFPAAAAAAAANDDSTLDLLMQQQQQQQQLLKSDQTALPKSDQPQQLLRNYDHHFENDVTPRPCPSPSSSLQGRKVLNNNDGGKKNIMTKKKEKRGRRINNKKKEETTTTGTTTTTIMKTPIRQRRRRRRQRGQQQLDTASTSPSQQQQVQPSPRNGLVAKLLGTNRLARVPFVRGGSGGSGGGGMMMMRQRNNNNNNTNNLEPTPENEEANNRPLDFRNQTHDSHATEKKQESDDKVNDVVRNNNIKSTNNSSTEEYNNTDNRSSNSSLEAAGDGPIDYIKTANSAHDLVSQITMQKDDFLSPSTSMSSSHNNKNKQQDSEENMWWWATGNGDRGVGGLGGGDGMLQGWLPAIVADIAEEFMAPQGREKKQKKKRKSSKKGGDDDTFPVSSDDDDEEDSDPFEDLSDNDTKGIKGTASESTIGGLNSNSYIVGDNTDLSAYRNNEEQPKEPIADDMKPHVEDIVHDVSTDRWTKKASSSSSASSSSPSSKRTSTEEVAINDNNQSNNNSQHQQQRTHVHRNPRVVLQIRKLEHNMEVQRMELGHYHPRVAASLVAIGVLRVENGEPDLAIDAILEALRIQKARRDPRSMARSLHVLADIYGRHLKEYDLAMSCYIDVQHIERRLYGPDHPENAHTLNRMGRVHASRNEFYEAMEKHQQALKVLKACVGEDPNHPAVSQTLIHIGEVYYQERNSLDNIVSSSGVQEEMSFFQTGMIDIIAHAHDSRGNYKKALGFLEEKLQLIPSLEDFPQHQYVSILNSLGTLSCKSGVFMEAIDYYQQALDIQMRHGCTPLEVATAKVLIGTVEYHLGQYHKALKLLEAALEVFRKNSSEDNDAAIAVADILHRIGLVKAALWYNAGAKKSLQSALEVQKRLGYPEDKDLSTLQTKLTLYWVEVNQGTMQHEAAVREIKTVLKQQEKAVGNKAHPILADTLLLLAKIYLLDTPSSSPTNANNNNNSNNTAIRLLRDSFQMREQFLGRDHPLQADTFYWIAVEGIGARRRRGEEQHPSQTRKMYQHGLTMFLSVLRVRKETLGERHIDVASCLGMIGRCYAGLGKTEEAMKCFDSALEMTTTAATVGGSDFDCHPCVGELYVGLGLVKMRQCQFDTARQHIEKAMTIYQENKIPSSHILRKEAAECYERIERDEMLCV